MDKEKYKSIESYKSLYEISRCWKLKTFNYLWHWKEAIVKVEILKRGHSRVSLQINKIKKRYLIHRLVYLTFNNLPLDSKIKVLHRKESLDKYWALNNDLDNLWWWTQKDNMRDCWNKWRWKVPMLKWEKIHSSKLKNEDILKIKDLYGKGCTQCVIANIFWVGQGNISRVVNNLTWKHITKL